MGRAEQLFARIRSGEVAEVANMIATPVVEELFLDYKQSSTVLPSRRLHDDDRKNFAKAVGGFGNSEGGVIIWGVDCRHTQRGDIPTGPAPIVDPIALKTLFDGAVGGLTLPAHSGVDNITLINPGRTDGFVISFVPAGFHVPYQTLFPKEEYYIRAGSNFLPTPHAVLAGLFGRHPQPVVSPITRFRSVELVQGQLVRINLDVAARNTGRGFADDMFGLVEIRVPDRVIPSFPRGREEYESWRTTNDGRDSWTVLLRGLRLPPGTEAPAFSITLDIHSRPDAHCRFSISLGSDRGPGAAKEIVFSAEFIADVFASYTAQDLDPHSRRLVQGRIDSLIKQRL
jgi:hypothetical protein